MVSPPLLSNYNKALSTVDDQYNQCIASLQEVKGLNERMLSGVGFKFTKDSSEYEWEPAPVNRKEKTSTQNLKHKPLQKI